MKICLKIKEFSCHFVGWMWGFGWGKLGMGDEATTFPGVVPGCQIAITTGLFDKGPFYQIEILSAYGPIPSHARAVLVTVTKIFLDRSKSGVYTVGVSRVDLSTLSTLYPHPIYRPTIQKQASRAGPKRAYPT